MRNLAHILTVVILMSCTAEPVAINYGVDACHFCKMTIVDKQHASQVVTIKGKAYKYDAIECMMNDLARWDRPEVKYRLAADYNNPGTLIDATTASYLLSESIPSPMGEFLSAFSSDSARDRILDTNDGEALNWSDLKRTFSN